MTHPSPKSATAQGAGSGSLRLPERRYSLLDRLLTGVDVGLRTVHARPSVSGRPTPGPKAGLGAELSNADRRLSGRLIRIDHAGEVAAQGLYQGQALTARTSKLREQMQQASDDENDHLAWCDQRLKELGATRSRMAPLWYGGAYAIGAAAGLVGDRVSLGFVRETERQVVAHLEDHLDRLPPDDDASRAILEQMKADEASHAVTAARAGAIELPRPVRRLMRAAAKVMTGSAYWI